MTDRLIYVALAVSVVGLLMLTYVSMVFDPPVASIGSIGTSSVGKSLHVAGNVSSFYEFKGGSQTLVLDDGTGKIDVYVDYSIAKAIPSLSKANKLDVVGVVDEYNGVLEIKPGNPDQVRILS